MQRGAVKVNQAMERIPENIASSPVDQKPLRSHIVERFTKESESSDWGKAAAKIAIFAVAVIAVILVASYVGPIWGIIAACVLLPIVMKV